MKESYIGVEFEWGCFAPQEYLVISVDIFDFTAGGRGRIVAVIC